MCIDVGLSVIHELSIILIGAAPDTGNLGVSALCHSALQSLATRLPSAQFTVFDHGRGVRQVEYQNGARRITIDLCGASNTRRYYVPESLQRSYFESRIGIGCGLPMRQISKSSVIVDVSGGDSFSNIYGLRRFQTVVYPKLITLNCGRPLILLPQTYGPYTNNRSKHLAARIVCGAMQCWTRDERSFDVLRQLLGDAFDPARHRCGVDMAFGLRAREAPEKLPPLLRAAVETGSDAGPLIGFNVSGLIFNDPEKAKSQYGFRADYGAAVESFLSRALASSPARVALIPHVLTPAGHYESDPQACERVAAALRERHGDRVMVATTTLDQSEVKWLISRCDWFCGTRMHSTIAGLSSGVPTATIAYSDKALGVFESCGQGAHVVDPRRCDTEEVVDRLLCSFNDRVRTRTSLAEHMPGVLAQAERQMDEIAAVVRESAGIDARHAKV